MNDASDHNIRPAARQDSSLILSFIKKLASYEKKLDLVTACVEDIEKYMFDRHISEGLIAEYRGRPAGFAVFFYVFSTFLGRPGIYIEDLYVDKEMRNKGLGMRMFSYIARLAIERGCIYLEWSVLTWNQPSIDLYKKMGAEIKDEWDQYRLSGGPLQKLADHNI